jgi:hypothetical protein
MAAELHRGSTSMRDYTPGSAVAAGEVITIAPLQYIAHRDIAANELGALACPAGSAAYKVDLHATYDVADGAQVLYDLTTGTAKAGGVHLGYAEGAAAGTSGATYVMVRHCLKTA